jgi:hypothetical protein
MMSTNVLNNNQSSCLGALFPVNSFTSCGKRTSAHTKTGGIAPPSALLPSKLPKSNISCFNSPKNTMLCSSLLADNIENQSLLIYLFTVLLYMKPCMHYSIKSSSRRSSIESDRVSSSPPTGNDDNRGTSTAADVVG